VGATYSSAGIEQHGKPGHGEDVAARVRIDVAGSEYGARIHDHHLQLRTASLQSEALALTLGHCVAESLHVFSPGRVLVAYSPVRFRKPNGVDRACVHETPYIGLQAGVHNGARAFHVHLALFVEIRFSERHIAGQVKNNAAAASRLYQDTLVADITLDSLNPGTRTPGSYQTAGVVSLSVKSPNTESSRGKSEGEA